MSFPWVETFGIGVPALVSVASAAVAFIEARRARQSEREVENLRMLEDRVSAHKYETYKPMLNILADAISGEGLPPDFAAKSREFATWLLVFGSDDAVTAWGRLMQSTYEAAPAQILVRMFLEFLREARRDMGDRHTSVTGLQILAPRITDLYQNQRYYEAITMPLDELFAKYAWTAPWEREFHQMNDDPMPGIEARTPDVTDESRPSADTSPPRQPHTTPRPGTRPRRRS